MKPELHVVLGMEPAAYDAEMESGRHTVGWTGMLASEDPRYHCHPLLGIIGHSHSSVGDARRPHGHRPVIGWDSTPIFVTDSNGGPTLARPTTQPDAERPEGRNRL